jgi:hypothetical protein
MKEHLLMGEEKSLNETFKEQLKLEHAKVVTGHQRGCYMKGQEKLWEEFSHDLASRDWAIYRLAVWGRRESQKRISQSCDLKDCMTGSRPGLEKRAWDDMTERTTMSSRPFARLRINAVAKGNSQRLNTKAGLGKGPVL